MLTYRKRGRIYHVRGTFRLGPEKREVKEHSSGCRDEEATQEYVRSLERELTEEILYGSRRRQKHVTFADAGACYLGKGLARGDTWRLGELNEVLGDCPLSEVKDGWAEFRAKRCAGLAPATVSRFRSVLVAALNYACEEWDIPVPKVPPIKFDNERIRWLTIPQADLLISCYADHVQPIARMLRFQGCRTQEALQLLWPNVDLKRRTIFFERTKNGQPRTVKMHELVDKDLAAIWQERGRPHQGHVFLTRWGKPYADTRDYKYPGGNPLRKAHATAMRRANIRPNGGTDFTPHDWRHHWASQAVMSGVDFETIRRLGGWKGLDMVKRYAAVSTEHMDSAVAKMR